VPSRTTLRLNFGAGLDRTTGIFQRAPGTFVDLRNLLLKEGKAEARKGLTEQVALTMNGSGVAATDLILVEAYRAALRNVVLAHQLGGGTTNLEVFLTATNGLNPIFQQTWTSPVTPDPQPPIVFGAEVYTRYFLAHSEEDMTKRRKTVYLTTGGALTALQGDLDGTGAKDIKFRGVRRYLNYLVGWGFGSDADKDRPEIVRLSDPEDPTVFHKEHLIYCGPRSEPVLTCEPTRSRILVLKEREAYEITGYDRATFGVRQVDPTYGVAGARLAQVVGDRVYSWTLEGPRVFEQGASVDLGLPLDLAGPDPASLAASGEAHLGFSTYLQTERVLAWLFPDRAAGKTRAYLLSIRDPDQPRWSYAEFQRALWCAGRVYKPTGGTGAPVGYPQITAFTLTGLSGPVSITNVSAIGDETIEVWVSINGGSYAKTQEVLAAGASQTVTIGPSDGVIAAATVSVAVRYRRGSAYKSNYVNPVTSGWDAAALAASVASATAGNVPPSPSSFIVTGTSNSTIGGKDFIAYAVGWVDAGAAVVGTTCEICESSGGPSSDPAILFSGIALGVQAGSVGPYLVSPSSPQRYIYLRHRGPDGVAGTLVPLTDNPLDPASGGL